MCGVLEHYEVPQRMVMGIERMPMDAMNVFFLARLAEFHCVLGHFGRAWPSRVGGTVF